MPFAPDFGLKMLNSGMDRGHSIHLVPFQMDHISVVNEDLFVTMANMVCDGQPHAVSLDFDGEILQKIRTICSEEIARLIEDELCENLEFGYTIRFPEPLLLSVTATLGELQVAEKEQFIPLVVQDVEGLESP